MAETPTRGTLTLVGTSAVALYTAPGSGWAVLRGVIIANELDDRPCRVTIGVHSSAADAAGRRLGKLVKVDPNKFEPVIFGLPLLASDVVYAIAAEASSATCVAEILTGP